MAQYHIYDIECPSCNQDVWINNGNIEDQTVSDVEAARCPWCKHEFLIPDDGWAARTGLGPTLESASIEDGFKSRREAAE